MVTQDSFTYSVETIFNGELSKLRDSRNKYQVIIISTWFDPSEKNAPYKHDIDNENMYINNVLDWIKEAEQHLESTGTILIYGIPRWLPFFATYLSKTMFFKYWIALKNKSTINDDRNFLSFHEGILVFVKNKNKFMLNRVRYPHIFCSQCHDYLADWGGKKHLRHEFGPVISDVWDDRDDFIIDGNQLSSITINRLLELTCSINDKVLIVKNVSEATHFFINTSQNEKSQSFAHEVKPIYSLLSSPECSDIKRNEIYIGDCVDIMTDWVKNKNTRFDLVFADPPYNLEKNYGESNDDLSSSQYIKWCNQWLNLSVSLLKPNGMLLVLNLPKWSFFHAEFLDNLLYFQRWIVWDALSDPRGKIMPAHYSLLMYTKNPTLFTFNKLEKIPTMDQCFRSKCINSRGISAPKEDISDIWYDIHRIKHKRDRDEHPCQLPMKLLERVILSTTKPGDCVLDPFMGTGTTAIAANKYGRFFVGIDIDPEYKKIALTKLKDSYSVSTKDYSQASLL